MKKDSVSKNRSSSKDKNNDDSNSNQNVQLNEQDNLTSAELNNLEMPENNLQSQENTNTDNNEFELSLDQNQDVNNDLKFDLEDENSLESISNNNMDTTSPSPLDSFQKKITPDVDKGTSKVAINKKSSMLILGFGIIAIIYIIYDLIQPEADLNNIEVKREVNRNLPIVKPVQDIGQNVIVPEVPKLPDAPQLTITLPQASSAPTPPPVMDLPPMSKNSLAPAPISNDPTNNASGLSSINLDQKLNFLSKEDEANELARKTAKMKASIMAFAGGSGKKKLTGLNQEGKSTTILSANTSQIAATYIAEMQRIIAQGKIIDAVLETAINSDLPGNVRAIVSRDVFSESGNNILIPRGSRLVGTYSAAIKYGQSRVQIAWSRLLRPDGVDVKIASTGVDALGRTGSEGEVDNHLVHNFAIAVLSSIINIGTAELAAKKVGNSQSSTTTISGGSTLDNSSGTVSSNPTTTTGETPTFQQQAYQQAIEKLNSVSDSYLSQLMSLPPTITIDQGTPLKVYVNQDIIFPGWSANLNKVIQ